MASHCAERYIGRALDSVLAQSLADLEVIVCDDASSDETVSVVAATMREDARVRLVALSENGGPARARNRALDLAQGEWVAVVDADDRIHPERLERLLAAAQHFDADIVADDLLLFDETRRSTGHLLVGDGFRFPMALTVPLVIGDRGGPALGYLKPLIRTRVLGALRYDETLRIGEDFDFLLRLVLGGVRAWLVPEPWYLYRRHASSISHRLPADALEAMIESMSRMIGEPATAAAGTRALLADRIAGLRAHLDYARVVDDLKAGRFGAAMGRLIRQPAMTARLGGWLASQVQRPFTALAGATPRHSATRHTIALADDAEGSLPSEWSFGRLVTVPAYVPSNAVDWTAASDRAAWLQIAALGMGANDLHPVGRAGAYAAGFSPGHPVQITEPYPAPTQTAAYPHATAALGAAE